jgi:hypothetical protein
MIKAGITQRTVQAAVTGDHTAVCGPRLVYELIYIESMVVKGTYNGRLRAVCKPVVLQKRPPLSQAMTTLSSRERTAASRAPRQK